MVDGGGGQAHERCEAVPLSANGERNACRQWVMTGGETRVRGGMERKTDREKNLLQPVFDAAACEEHALTQAAEEKWWPRSQ